MAIEISLEPQSRYGKYKVQIVSLKNQNLKVWLSKLRLDVSPTEWKWADFSLASALSFFASAWQSLVKGQKTLLPMNLLPTSFAAWSSLALPHLYYGLQYLYRGQQVPNVTEKGMFISTYCGTLPFKICHGLFRYLLHIAVWQCGPYSNWLRILKSFCFFGSGCQMWELMKTVFATSQHKTGCIHKSLDRLVCLCLEKAGITNKCLSGSENTIM